MQVHYNIIYWKDMKREQKCLNVPSNSNIVFFANLHRIAETMSILLKNIFHTLNSFKDKDKR